MSADPICFTCLHPKYAHDQGECIGTGCECEGYVPFRDMGYNPSPMSGIVAERDRLRRRNGSALAIVRKQLGEPCPDGPDCLFCTWLRSVETALAGRDNDLAGRMIWPACLAGSHCPEKGMLRRTIGVNGDLVDGLHTSDEPARSIPGRRA
jgi:hypothetical protein